MEMVVVTDQGADARNGYIVETHCLDHGLLKEERNEPRSRPLIVLAVQSIARRFSPIPADCTYVNFQPASMGAVRLKSLAICQADVPNAKFAAVDLTPLASDRLDDGHHSWMRELTPAVARRAVHVVTPAFKSLWKHEKAARILR